MALLQFKLQIFLSPTARFLTIPGLALPGLLYNLPFYKVTLESATERLKTSSSLQILSALAIANPQAIADYLSSVPCLQLGLRKLRAIQFIPIFFQTVK